MARRINGIKVFSATMAKDRENLGERVTDWMRANPTLEIDDVVIKQSSDEAFHCISISVLFFDHVRAP